MFTYAFPHRPSHIFAEKRLLFVDGPAAGGNMDAVRGELHRKQQAEREGGVRPEGELSNEAQTDELVTSARGHINTFRERAQEIPALRDGLESRIAQFMLSSYERFDANRNRVRERSEFETYSQQMLQRIQEIVERYSPQQEARAVAGAAETARGAAEGAAEVEAPNEPLNEANLRTTDGLDLEFRKYRKQSRELQTAGGELSRQMATFQEAHKQFEEGKKSLSVIGGGIGAALASTGIGAPVAMFLGRGSSLFGWEFRQDPETERMRREHTELKARVAERMTELEAKKRELETFGVAMNGADDHLRAQENETHGRRRGEVTAQEEELQRRQEEGGVQYAAVARQREQLNEQRRQLEEYRISLQTQQETIGDAEQNTRVQREQLESSGSMITTAVTQLEQLLTQPNLPEEQRVAIQMQLGTLQGHQGQIRTGLTQMEGGIEQMNEAEIEVTQAQFQIDENFFSIQHQLTDVINPAVASIDDALAAIETMRVQLPEVSASVDQDHEQRLQLIDNLDQQIGDVVLDSGLGNDQLFGSLRQQKEWLDKVEINPPSVWEASPLAFAMGKLSEGIQWCSGKIFENGIFALSGWLKEITKDIPVLNVITQVGLNIVVDLPAGLLEAAVGLVGGVAHIIAHPVDAVKGLGALIGRDPATGEWTWGKAGEAWGMLIGWQHISNGEVGRGIGHAALNILLTATGAGAAGTGANVAARAAGLAGRIAQAGRLGRIGLYARAIAAHPVAFGRVAAVEFSSNIGRNSLNLITAAPRGIVSLGRMLVTPRAIRLSTRATSLADDMGRLAQNARIGGRNLSELGMNLDDVARIPSHELADVFGIARNDIGGLHQLARLEQQAAQFVRLRGARQAALLQSAHPDLADVANLRGQALDDFVASQRELADLDPALYARRVGESQGLRGAELDRFCAEFQLTDRAHQVVHATPEGVIAFDETGRLVVHRDPVAITQYIDEAAAARGISPDVLRIEVAEQMVGRTLSQAERHAVIAAHEEAGVVGELTQAQIMARARPMIDAFVQERLARAFPGRTSEQIAQARAAARRRSRGEAAEIPAGFTPDEIADIARMDRQLRSMARRDVQVLMDRGIAGQARAPAANPRRSGNTNDTVVTVIDDAADTGLNPTPVPASRPAAARPSNRPRGTEAPRSRFDDDLISYSRPTATGAQNEAKFLRDLLPDDCRYILDNPSVSGTTTPQLAAIRARYRWQLREQYRTLTSQQLRGEHQTLLNGRVRGDQLVMSEKIAIQEMRAAYRTARRREAPIGPAARPSVGRQPPEGATNGARVAAEGPRPPTGLLDDPARAPLLDPATVTERAQWRRIYRGTTPEGLQNAASSLRNRRNQLQTQKAAETNPANAAALDRQLRNLKEQTRHCDAELALRRASRELGAEGRTLLRRPDLQGQAIQLEGRSPIRRTPRNEANYDILGEIPNGRGVDSDILVGRWDSKRGYTTEVISRNGITRQHLDFYQRARRMPNEVLQQARRNVLENPGGVGFDELPRILDAEARFRRLGPPGSTPAARGSRGPRLERTAETSGGGWRPQDALSRARNTNNLMHGQGYYWPRRLFSSSTRFVGELFPINAIGRWAFSPRRQIVGDLSRMRSMQREARDMRARGLTPETNPRLRLLEESITASSGRIRNHYRARRRMRGLETADDAAVARSTPRVTPERRVQLEHELVGLEAEAGALRGGATPEAATRARQIAERRAQIVNELGAADGTSQAGGVAAGPAATAARRSVPASEANTVLIPPRSNSTPALGRSPAGPAQRSRVTPSPSADVPLTTVDIVNRLTARGARPIRFHGRPGEYQFIGLSPDGQLAFVRRGAAATDPPVLIRPDRFRFERPPARTPPSASARPSRPRREPVNMNEPVFGPREWPPRSSRSNRNPGRARPAPAAQPRSAPGEGVGLGEEWFPYDGPDAPVLDDAALGPRPGANVQPGGVPRPAPEIAATVPPLRMGDAVSLVDDPLQAWSVLREISPELYEVRSLITGELRQVRRVEIQPRNSTPPL